MSDLEENPVVSCPVDQVALSGEYDLSRHDEVLEAVVKRTTTQLVDVDMSAVEFIDSTGFGALIRAQGRLDIEGRHLRLVKVPDNVRALIDLLALRDYLDVRQGTADRTTDGTTDD